MLRVEALEWQTWSPGTIPGAAGLLTRLRAGAHELCDAAEWIDWLGRPTQVVLSDPGGLVASGPGGWAEIVRCGQDLLWLPPQDLRHPASRALGRTGGLIVPDAAWEALRAQVGIRLPPADRFAVAKRSHLAGLWLRQARPVLVADRLEALEREVRARVLAGRVTAAEVILEALVAVRRWLEDDPDAPLRGRLAPIGSARVETLFLEGPGVEAWRGLAAVEQRLLPLVDLERAYLPDPAEGLSLAELAR